MLDLRRKSVARRAIHLDGSRCVLKQRFFALAAAFLAVAGASAAPPGAVISNTATLDYLDDAGLTVTIDSNTVNLTTAVVRSPATVDFTRVLATGAGDYQESVGPAACDQSGTFVALVDPVVSGGNSIDPTLIAEVNTTSSYNLGEPLFLRLTDSDQNLDYQVSETVVVTVSHDTNGDRETIRLTETGANTGIFAGYVPSSGAAPAAGDCVLQGSTETTIRVSYQDPADAADTAVASALLDPVSRVFESASGAIVDGVRIELVDAITGAPAIVYGNDGTSIFPSAITAGTTVTDSSGTSYVFDVGEYRFPVVPNGDYRIVATPPAGYAFPSSAAVTDMQALPGAPFELGPASFGTSFTQTGGQLLDWDIPLDTRSTALFLQKQTQTSVASPGDFVRYDLVLENAAGIDLTDDIQVIDRLPPGVRYVSGSTKMNGNSAPDPLISPDARTLEFSPGSLSLGERMTISYVVEIIGGRPDQELINTAIAQAGTGLASNEATVSIRLEEDLFRSTGTIIGRVLEADCNEDTFTEDQGVAGIRVYLEDGRYAVTDAGGRFHFEGIKTGTHVAQIDTFTVPDHFDVVGCSGGNGFAGSADSQFVRLSPGGLQRSDFYLRRKPRPEGRIDLELRSRGTDSAERVAYELQLNGVGNVAIGNIDVMFMLPDGVSYVPGSMRIDGAALGDPRTQDSLLSMALDGQHGSWQRTVNFEAAIQPDVDGELTTKAMATFDTPMAAKQQTPVAETRMLREPAVSEDEDYVLDLKFAVLSDELSAADMLQLDRLIAQWQGVSDIRIHAVGHSDNQRIAARNLHLFEDNYVLSSARAWSAVFYVANALGVPMKNLHVEGRGPDQPVATNSTASGRQANRRVAMALSGVRPAKPSFLEVTQESSGTKATATRGAVPGEEDSEPERAEIDVNAGLPASQIEAPVDTLEPGIAMMLPERGFQPAIAATKVSIKHEPLQSVKLWVNDVPVSVVNFDAMALNADRSIAVSRWAGVDLAEGNNTITAVVENADGSLARKIERKLYFAGPSMRAELLEEKSVLVADGKSRPVVAVRLFDGAGKPTRAGSVGSFRVDAPHRSWWDVENERKNALVSIAPREPVYRVGKDGVALIELEPTTQSGEVTLRFRLPNQREQEIRAWLKPATRDWILVGFAEGTAAYNTLADNIAIANAAGLEDGYADDGRVAFFAKGSIKGEYLLTLAYDSDRERNLTRNRFDTVIDPNAHYQLYADTSEQRYEAPSQRKLYVKLERNQFNALFGDFNTGLSVTDLARYERHFNGFKSEYRGDALAYTLFAADSDQGFHRDELRGDGTSGLYRLSVAPIIVNSEQVRIEVRDRFDSGLVISESRLARFLDYNIDPVNGTIFFKQPVPSRDLEFNPIYIVVEYESASTGESDLVAGGRISLRSPQETVELGLTHISDESTGAEAELSGTDLRWQVNDQTLFKAEYAESSSTTGGLEQRGSALSVELEHNSDLAEVHAYVRQVDDGFGLGQQSAADKGIRRLGLDARMEINERWSVEGTAANQQNLDTKDIRNLLNTQLRYKRKALSVSAGVTYADDKTESGERRRSSLGEIGVARKLFNGRLTLRAAASTSLSGDSGNLDQPERTVIGADYRIARGIDLVAEYEDARGSDIESTMTRLGVKATPWNRGQINTFVTNEATEFGPRLFANVGLVQGFQLNERWTLDIGFDQTDTLRDPGAPLFDPDRELASGSLNENFHALYTGVMYKADRWSANSRIEYRDSDSEERTSVLVGWYREPTTGHGLSASLTVLTSDNVTGNELAAADLKVGWAWRLADSHWSFLNRTDLVYEDTTANGQALNSWRIVNNFNANRRFSSASQLSLQYAFKYVRSEFDGDGFNGYTDLVGIDYRRGIGERWDAGIQTSIYSSHRADIVDYGYGLDVGYNVGRNMWLTLGYNITGFHDSDFAESRYTAQGPYVRFSIKASQHILKKVAGQRP